MKNARVELKSGNLTGTPAESRVGETNLPLRDPGFVQEELGFGKVRVVRNDLTDSDLMVVETAKNGRRSGDLALPAVRRETRLPSKRAEGWDRLSARLFIAGRSHF